jgi:CHAD domain-containing protein
MLDCDAPGAEAIQLVLRQRLEEMCALRDRALDWSDPEGVHSMRVASRRLRSAIADFKPYVRQGTLPRERLKMIAADLGAVRDEDVSLLALERLEQKVDERVAAGIEAIAEERRRRRLKEREALQLSISNTAIVEFAQDFLDGLEAATQSPQIKSDPTVKDHTFRQVGVEVVSRRLKGLSDGSGCIYDPTRMKELHRLRILAKRLRYAVELFSPCWKDEFKTIAKEVAQMQTSLGGLHDCDMWIAELGARLEKSHQARRHGHASDPNSDAAVWLLRHFARERTDHYRDALARWQEWHATGFLKQFKKLLRKN